MARYFEAMLDDLVEQGFMECMEDENGYRYYTATQITTLDLFTINETQNSTDEAPSPW